MNPQARLRERQSLNRSSFALASLVKTPDVSPCMTRLAATSSDNFADATYQALLSHQETQLLQSAQRFKTFHPYWAIAESFTHNFARWKKLPVLYQGEGTLGPRMAAVCDQLWTRHKAYGITGADCPQFPYQILGDVRDYLLPPSTDADIVSPLNSKRAVVCPSADGGFVFFAANFIFNEPWHRITYSNSTTCEQLLLELDGVDIWQMDTLVDIDQHADIALALEQARKQEQSGTQKMLERLLRET